MGIGTYIYIGLKTYMGIGLLALIIINDNVKYKT